MTLRDERRSSIQQCEDLESIPISMVPFGASIDVSKRVVLLVSQIFPQVALDLINSLPL